MLTAPSHPPLQHLKHWTLTIVRSKNWLGEETGHCTRVSKLTNYNRALLDPALACHVSTEATAK